MTNPIQIRLPQDLRTKIAKIAKHNHLSESDVIRICLAQNVPVIAEHGLTIQPGVAAKSSKSKAA